MHTAIARTLIVATTAIAFALPSRSAAITLFTQNFTPANGPCNNSPFNSFPLGWTRFDIDGGAPVTEVFWVTRTWTVRDDFKFDSSECVALSNSWFTTPGVANDFMCTSLISLLPQSRVRWRAVSYDPNFRDSYEVRVMTAVPAGATGDIGNLLSASTVVYETAAEEPAWTTHVASLAAFGNQFVRICYRNKSDDRFLLAIDDIVVERVGIDQLLRLVDPVSEYTQVPSWLGLAIARGALLVNGGEGTVTNAVLRADTFVNGQVIGSVESAPLPTLLGSVRVTLPDLIPDRPGDWFIRYSVHSDQSAVDVDPANDYRDSDKVVVGDAELSRDKGDTIGIIGIGTGTGGELGQQFDLPRQARISGIRFTMLGFPDASWTGTPIFANLRAYDQVTGKPGLLIASTLPVAASADGGTYDAMLAGGSVEVPAGRYVLTVVEPIVLGDDLRPLSLPLAQTREVFTPGTVWVIWPTIPGGTWANIESFGSTFARASRVTILFDRSLLSDSFETPVAVIVPPPAPRPEPAGEFATRRKPASAQRLIDALRH
jgi:hypothetical protein